MADHERIWLQHPDDAGPHEGRLWCEDNPWDDADENKPPTEYVRADIAVAQLATARRLLATIPRELWGDVALAEALAAGLLERDDA